MYDFTIEDIVSLPGAYCSITEVLDEPVIFSRCYINKIKDWFGVFFTWIAPGTNFTFSEYEARRDFDDPCGASPTQDLI